MCLVRRNLRDMLLLLARSCQYFHHSLLQARLHCRPNLGILRMGFRLCQGNIDSPLLPADFLLDAATEEVGGDARLLSLLVELD